MAVPVSVSDAARVLGVDASRVRALVAAGALSADKVGGVWLVDRESLAARQRLPAAAGRPLAPLNAWAALLAASGVALPVGFAASQAWRVRRSLATYGLAGLEARLRSRAEVSSHWALPGELRALRERSGIVLTGMSAAGALNIGVVGGDAVDAYVPEAAIADVRSEHALEPLRGPGSNVVLRAVPDGAWLLEDRSVAPIAAVALDLMFEADARAARVGREVVARLDRGIRADD